MNDSSVIEKDLRAIGAEVERVAGGAVFTLRGTHGYVGGPQFDDDNDWPVHCRVPIPASAPNFELDLRPQTEEDCRMVERGEALDLKLDDGPFDRIFIVEAAPWDIIAAVFDARVRADWTALAPCRLRRECDVLHLAAGQPGGPTRVATVVGVAVMVAERLEWVGAAIKTRDGTVPAEAYRAAPGLSRSAEDERRADKEIADVREVRRLRVQVQGASFGVALIAVLVAATMLGLLRHC